MNYRGDFALGATVDFKFPTVDVSGIPFTLAGSPAVAAYVGNSTTEITAGITLTVDFDGRTGLNHVRVVASGGNGFAAQTDVEIVVTAGTVDGDSIVGYVVGGFSIENRYATAASTPAAIADAVWDEARAGHVAAGSFGEGVASVQGNLTGSVGSVTGAVGSVTGNVGGNLIGNVLGAVAGSVGSIAGVSFPANFGTLSIDANGRVKAQVGLFKNTARQFFQFAMTDVVNHAPMPGLTNGDFTAKTVAIDNAAPAPLSGSVTEVGGGFYRIDLTSGEANGNNLAFVFEATGADPTLLSVVTSA